jgi:simple sugar transport system ATP-binding protein
VVSDRKTADTDLRGVVRDMVGRDVSQSQAPDRRSGDPGIALGVKRLWVDMPGETVRDASFDVREGEIFGIAGLAGQGKMGVPNGIMGLFPAGGEISVRGKPFALGDSRSAIAAGMAFVSEDRRGVGLLLDEGVDWNIAFAAMQSKGACLKKFLGGVFSLRDEKAMRELARAYIDALDIKCRDHRQAAKELSGGNQQKVCLAKAFALEPDILFVAEPTRGIDVGAKSLVLEALLRANREKGTTIVIASSELEELRSVCHRIAVVNEGRIAGILDAEADAVEFGLLMSGERIGS